ncbi:hypothetical protein KCU65_g2953, partial [Aureobasidium melanogenum]
MEPDPFDIDAFMRSFRRANPNITFAELMQHLFPPKRGHPYILDLPLDILELVIHFMDTNDITALRSTCKKLEKAAMSKFVDQFIKCRRHILNLYSLVSLAGVVRHPIFGKAIKTIIIDTTFPLENDEPTRSHCTHNDLYQILEEIFGYLSLHGNLETLGVTDRNPTSVGIQWLLSRPTAHHFKQERGHMLLKVQECAKDANLTISQLDVDSAQHLGSDSMGLEVDAFASTVFELAGGLSPSVSLKFKVSMTNMTEFRLIWDHERKGLEITGLTEWHLNVPDNMVFGLFQDMTSVSAANITELTLSDCHARMDHDYRKLMELLRICSGTLKRVKLSGILIESDSKWSPVLRHLARAPFLMDFGLEALSRKLHTFVNSKWQSAIIVHIDRAFGNGDKVSAELNDLAAMVEADEFAWEPIDDREPEKESHRMTSRRKTLEMVEDSLQAMKTYCKKLRTWKMKKKDNRYAHAG